MDHENSLETLNLLIRDKNLAASITELTLRSRIQEYSPINLEFLENLVSLECMRLHEIKFRDETELNAINELLSKSHSIKELTCVGLNQRLVHFRGIRGLKAVTWKGNIIYTFNAMCEVLSDSCTTIEILHLDIYNMSPSQCNRLFGLYFPCLRSLTIDVLGDPPTTGFGFTDFIIAHSITLEELDMTSECDALACASFSKPHSLKSLHKDVLPHLRAFKGYIEDFKTMAEANIHSLSTTLQRLWINPGIEKFLSWDELCDVFNAVNGSLSSLTELTFSDMSNLDDGDIRDVMEILAMTCGSSLRVLKGLGIPKWFQTDQLGDLFNLFEKLETVHYHTGRYRMVWKR